MRISIVMATYNGAGYIKDQLESFVAQTRWPDELVIVDDGSHDQTREIIADFAKTSPFPTYCETNPKTLGYAQNFGKALSKATGDLVFLSDQDDYWLPEKIKVIESLTQERDNEFVFINDAEMVTPSMGRTGLTRLGQVASGGYSANEYVQGACTAVKTDFLNVVLPIPVGVTHDSWIHWLADALDARYVYPEALQLFRRHSANASESPTSRTYRVSRFHRLKMALDRMAKSEETRMETLETQIAAQNEVSRRLKCAEPLVSEKWPWKLESSWATRRQMRIDSTVIGQRRAISEHCRPARCARQLRLVFRVGWARYGGWKEFVKDIVIR